MKTEWTVDNVMALDPCYERGKIEKLWGDNASLHINDMLNLGISVADKVWFAFRADLIVNKRLFLAEMLELIPSNKILEAVKTIISMLKDGKEYTCAEWRAEAEAGVAASWSAEAWSAEAAEAAEASACRASVLPSDVLELLKKHIKSGGKT